MIRPINGLKAIKPNEDNKILWHIVNYTPDLGNIYQHIILNNAFGYWQRHMWPIHFKSTKNIEEAHIKIYFKENGDQDLPAPFKKGSLAFGIAPHKGEHTGKLFFNDTVDWSTLLDPDGYWLLKVAVHEIGHVLNLSHNEDPADVMFARYRKGQHKIEITEPTISLLTMLYERYM